MKKYFLLVIALCLPIAYAAAQDSYGSSYNQVLKLIDAMDETNGPLADANWPDAWKNDGTPVVPVVNATFEATDYNGYRVVAEFGFIGIYKSEIFKGIWGGASGNYNYVGAGSIDWTDKGWVQKPDVPIILEPTLSGATVKDQQRDDLTFLKTLNLSGNDFNSIQIAGHDRMKALETIDLSDDLNGLDLFEISGCPNLKTLNVSATSVSVANNGLLFSTINGFNVTATSYTYAPQGTVNLTFPVNAVDLSAEDAIGTTFSNWSVAPVSSNGGVFVFADAQIGQTITVALNNALYPALTDLSLSITLADGDYHITTPAELDDVRNHLAGTFTLDADIDLTDYIAENYPTEGWLPIGNGTAKFTGVFNGNGHVISGLWIDRPNTAFVGLFGATGDYRYLNGTDALGATPANSGLTKGATVKDLGIVAGTISGDYNVGALAGAMGNSIVSGIYVSATVVGKNESGHGYNIGGLAGSFWGNKAQTVLQDCYTTGSVSGFREVGGVLGSTFQNDATIKINRIYSTCDVSLLKGYFQSAVGGIIGKYQSPDGLVKINSSFAMNDTIIGEQATGSGRTGRFIGGFADGGNPKLFADNIYGLKTTQIRLYNYTGSDYSNTWHEIDPDGVINADDATADDRKARHKHGINKTAQQLIDQSTYAIEKTDCNWDFDETWTMSNDYYPLPILKKLPASAQPATYPAHLKFEVTVTATAGENGSISTHTDVKAGDDVTVEVTPNANYLVDEFTVNGVDKRSELADNKYTIACIKEDYTVHVTFVFDQKTGILAPQTIANNLPVATRYYTMQGVAIAHPLETGLYIARQQYPSGKEIITKVFIHKEK
ncbi:MAG: hypothetical protein LBM08_11175 [Dysgonamonadaceae bacterium]|jgi:hypothetical protein|nr:hypothetical protein [Dysgonamonadaceae bacterium]